MRHGLPMVFVLVLIASVVTACSYPETYTPPPAENPLLRPVDSGEARAVVDQFIGSLEVGDIEGAAALLTGRALEASRTLAGASDVTMISVAEDTSLQDKAAKYFEVQCEVTYPESAVAQSGVHLYRLRVTRTAEGLRIEDLGP